MVALVAAVVLSLAAVEALNVHGKTSISSKSAPTRLATCLAKRDSVISLLKFAGIGQSLSNSVRINLRNSILSLQHYSLMMLYMLVKSSSMMLT